MNSVYLSPPGKVIRTMRAKSVDLVYTTIPHIPLKVKGYTKEELNEKRRALRNVIVPVLSACAPLLKPAGVLAVRSHFAQESILHQLGRYPVNTVYATEKQTIVPFTNRGNWVRSWDHNITIELFSNGPIPTLPDDSLTETMNWYSAREDFTRNKDGQRPLMDTKPRTFQYTTQNCYVTEQYTTTVARLLKTFAKQVVFDPFLTQDTVILLTNDKPINVVGCTQDKKLFQRFIDLRNKKKLKVQLAQTK